MGQRWIPSEQVNIESSHKLIWIEYSHVLGVFKTICSKADSVGRKKQLGTSQFWIDSWPFSLIFQAGGLQAKQSKPSDVMKSGIKQKQRDSFAIS